MRLASKIFLATSLFMLVLVAVAAMSLIAVNRLVGVNREIVSRAVPALRLEAKLREAMFTLIRLESRSAVLRDTRYEALWNTRAAVVAQNLDRLRLFLITPEEEKRRRKTVAAFERYRALVAAGRAARGRSARGAPRISLLAPRTAAERTERSLQRIMEATSDGLRVSQERARALEQRTWNTISIALPASFLVALLGAALLAYRITRSLRRLSVATAEVARGSFSGGVPVRSRDELGQLAQAFNRMAAKLSELDRAKEDFFSHISHELRTPLSAVCEAAELMRHQKLGSLTVEQSRLVDHITTSTERVLGLVNQILQLSRLREGLLAIERRTVHLGAVAERALKELHPQAEARGLTLERDGAPSELTVVGDEGRLLEVVVNLLSNAVKFTPAGGRVRLRLAERDGEAEIVVEDTGPGIAPEALPHVFDRYWQVPGTQGGSGLGLAIVKRIVEAHGGRVVAESRPGGGARFTVHLPREAAA